MFMMKLLILFLIIVLCQVLSPTVGSLIKLNNGGYEDIVIAINPSVTENLKIITSIQNMVKEATSYLFNATKKRVFIRSVKILIPSTWRNKNYTKSTIETYDKADVIVASPYLKNGNTPYTLQYGRCGEPGKYIHFTPDFLLNDDLLKAYGPRGRVFVHEWAHLRWGVFDEYNTDMPFYISSKKEIEATRCSLGITGRYQRTVSQCQGGVCSPKCVVSKTTGLYEAGCNFYPNNPTQPANASIMYLQSLNTVTAFCDSTNHNTEAPNLQNRMCNSRSAWEVILNSTDMSSSPPRINNNIPEPTFTLLQPGNRIVTLVLDTSGSMASYNRIERLYQAASIFLLQIIETGSSVGIVTFSSLASIISPLVTVNADTQRNYLKSLLPISANGGTDICSGILSGLMVNIEYDGSTNGTEIVLLTDGEDNYDTKLCFPNIAASGAVIHFIALGPYASVALEDIANMTGGLNFKATDNLEANGLIDAFTQIQTRNGDSSQQVVQLESIGKTLDTNVCLNGSIYLDNTVGNDTVFLVTWQTEVPIITLIDPNRNKYTAINFTSDNTAKTSTLKIQGIAETGSWEYILCNSILSSQVISIVVTSMAAATDTTPITVEAYMNSNKNSYPNPMVAYAVVQQGLVPVIGVNVTAIIDVDKGNSTILELLDNGAGADLVKDDGIYSRYFTAFSANGRYSLKVRVEGKNTSGYALPASRALYVPGYVENGTVIMNPPDPANNISNIPSTNVGDFTRTVSGGSFVVSNVPAVIPEDIYRPDKITDLMGQIINYTVVLSWTATGDDLDQGMASMYDLRMSTEPRELLNNFANATAVNVSSLVPQPAGLSETFKFVPKNITIQNGTILYFALIAVDKVSQQSDVSNLAQAALLIPPIEPTTTPLPPTTNQSSTYRSTTVHRSTTASTSTTTANRSTTASTSTTTAKTQCRPGFPPVDCDEDGVNELKTSLVVLFLCAFVAIGFM